MNKILLSIVTSVVTITFLCSAVLLSHPREIDDTTVWQNYDRYKEASLKNRLFKHDDLTPLIQKHVASGLLKSEVLGNSVKGRSINHLTFGSGKTKVLLWSQMHGDESTATMALFDIFNFFAADDENNAFRKHITDNLELHFVPMLNPDGAEVWKRRNDLDIDINRDARALNTPEGRILMNIANKLKPEFGFNLHDQSTLYSAGETKNQATISFLAPAYNYSKDMNQVRENATKLIVLMNRTLQKYASEKVAKYDDAHDPRCFGDTFQGKGISTILIESGGYPGDPEKQYIRKLNYYAILSALSSIASNSYQTESTHDYLAIPENNRSLYDVIVRNVQVTKASTTYRTNIGINHSQILDPGKRSMSYRGSILELSDMDKNFGYNEVDASAFNTVPGRIKTMKKTEWEKLNLSEEVKLAQEGYLFIHFSDQRSALGPIKSRLLNLTNSTNEAAKAIGLGEAANFLLVKNDKPVYAVINGFVVDLRNQVLALPNSFGY